MENDWLNQESKKYYSQRGEEGIIEEILSLIGAIDGWCVEFGAWDGKTGSNSYYFIKEKGFKSVMIEGEHSRFVELEENMKSFDVTCINRYIAYEGENRLDAILANTEIPKSFSFASIDIDGNDYHVWNSLKEYRPKCVIIEFNPSISNEVDFVQERNPTLNQGNSAKALVRLAKSKGYELVAANLNNLFFVEDIYFDRFGISDNDLCKIRTDLSKVTYIFNGYDGHVFVRGYQKLDLYSLEYKERKMQMMPSFLQEWSSSSPLKRTLQRLHRSITKRL